MQTPGCVEATFRDAAYHDYYNVLAEDCVAAYRQEEHEASFNDPAGKTHSASRAQDRSDLESDLQDAESAAPQHTRVSGPYADRVRSSPHSSYGRDVCA